MKRFAVLLFFVPIFLGASISTAEPTFPLLDKLCEGRVHANRFVLIFNDEFPVFSSWPNSLALYFDCETRHLLVRHVAVNEEMNDTHVTLLHTLATGPAYVSLKLRGLDGVTVEISGMDTSVVPESGSELEFFMHVKYEARLRMARSLSSREIGYPVFPATIARQVRVTGKGVNQALDRGLLEPKHFAFEDIMNEYRPDPTGFGKQAAFVTDPMELIGEPDPFELYREISNLNERTPSRKRILRLRSPRNHCDQLLEG